MNSLFSEQQWLWLGARFQEGYSLADLSQFLGIHRETLRRGLIRHGFKPVRKSALPPLNTYKKEFLQLNW